jgi:hypothetical protein
MNGVLAVILAVAGVILGAGSALADRVWKAGTGQVLARAGGLSVLAWIIGMAGQVIARIAVLQVRRVSAGSQGAVIPATSLDPATGTPHRS